MNSRLTLSSLALVALGFCTQCTGPGWKNYQPGNEFETVFSGVPFFNQANADAWTPPSRLLPQGERMGLIDWTPAEANVVLTDAAEGYVSTLEIAPVVDAQGNAIKSRITRRGGERVAAPVYEVVTQTPSPEPIKASPRKRFQLPWQRTKEVSSPIEIPSIPESAPAPRLQKPKPTPVKQVAPKLKTPKPAARPQTQIERLYPKPTPKPTPKLTAPAVTEPAPEFRPLP